MSKYDKLWQYLKNSGAPTVELTFIEINEITGAPIDHSFLSYKKELKAYGYAVGRISLKDQSVAFNRLEDTKG